MLSITGMLLTLFILLAHLVNFSARSAFFALSLSLLAIVALIWMYRSSCVPYLMATFSVLSVIRIIGLNGYYFALYPALLALLCLIILFFYIAYQDIKQQTIFLGADAYHMSAYEWQLSFIRIYVGFDLIAHCAEKLFDGPIAFQSDVMAFIHLNVIDPTFLVKLAGLCELAGAISLGLGLLTRIGAIGTALYIMIATIIGGHFLKSFIWASPGGGWEYPLMWTVLILSYSVLGANKFSIDGVLNKKFTLPTWSKRLMGIR